MHVRSRLPISERRACVVVGQPRSTQRRRLKTADDEAALTASIVRLATRYGYRRIREIRALGVPGGKPWHVRLPATEAPAMILDAGNMAVATSGAAGFRFDEDGRYNHLFHPATGRCSDPA